MGARVAIATNPPFPHQYAQNLGDPGLDRIRRRKRLIVGVKDNLPPLGYRNDAGELMGFEIAIARRLAAELLGDANALELVPLKNQERLPALFRGDVDLVIAQVTLTSDRQRLVQFSPPYYTSGIRIITPQSQFTRLSELQGRRLGVLAQSDAVDVIRIRLPNATLVRLPSYAAARDALQQGRIDAFAGDEVVLAGWQLPGELSPVPMNPVQMNPVPMNPVPMNKPQMNPAQWSWVGDRLSSAPLAIALPKGLQQESLRKALDSRLRQWQAEGWFQQQAEQWGLGR